MYVVYVLKNRPGKFYVGITDDVSRRLADHNRGVSRWTRGKGAWSLLWQSEKMSLSAARKLENRLKRQGRGSGFFTITGIPRTGS